MTRSVLILFGRLVALAASGVIASSCGGSTGAPHREGPQPIFAPSGFIADQDVAVDSRGDAVAIWTAVPLHKPDAPSAVYAAVRVRDRGPWRSARRLSPIGQDAQSVAVEMSPSGEAVAVWEGLGYGKKLVSSSCSVWSRTSKVATGLWTSPARIARDCDGDSLQMGMDHAGNATAMWSGGIVATRDGSDGRWSRAELIPTIPRFAEAPLLAVGAGGDAVVLFSRICVHVTAACTAAADDPSGLGDSLPRVLESTIRSTRRGWEPAQQLDSGQDLYPVIRDVAMEGAGHATAIWTKGENLMASTRGSSRWERSQTLSTSGLGPLVGEGASGEGAVGVDEAGNAIAVWVGYRAKAGSVVVARSLRVRGTLNWRPPRVTVDFGTITFPSVGLAIGPSGTVANVWSGSAPDGRGVAARLGKLPTDQWESISRHAPPPHGWLAFGAVAVSETGAGTATILWTTRSSADVERLYAFSLEK